MGSYAKRIFTAVLCLSVMNLIFAFQNQDLNQTYRELPQEVHLFIADIKISRMIQDAQNQGNPEKLNQLKEAQGLLWEATRQYEYFRTQKEALLQENWREHLNWAAPSPNTPPLGKSPLGLLEHLHLFEEGAVQTNASIMVQSVQYSESQARQHQALGESIKIMGRMISSAQKILGQARYFSSQYRIYIEAPLDYIQESGSEAFPINLVKRKADGSPASNVLINVLEAEYEISPAAWANKHQEVLLKKFPDLSHFAVEEHSGTDYEFRAKYGYVYTWEGNPIKALVLVHKRGQQAVLTICAAREENFNREEFDKIIASYHH